MLLIFHTILFIDWWKFWKWLNCVCGYDSSWTAAAGRQRVCSRMYPVPPSLPPLFLSLIPSISPAPCDTHHLLSAKQVIYILSLPGLPLFVKWPLCKSLTEQGANYQTIWRKLCFSSFGSTFQTIAIMFLSCGRVLHKHSRAMVADSKVC